MPAESHRQSDLFLSLLTVLFIGLKLTGYIDWSWWWVLSPIWIPGLAAIAILGSAFLYIRFKK